MVSLSSGINEYLIFSAVHTFREMIDMQGDFADGYVSARFMYPPG
jgi:hypothetical protein